MPSRRGGCAIVIFLLISIPQGHSEIARLRKAKVPLALIAKEVAYSSRYLVIGAALLVLVIMTSQQTA